MNSARQPKRLTIQDAFATGDINEIASTYYAILDRITEWDRSVASIVVAPVKEDGTTNWEYAHPVNLMPPSSDSGPEDINEARRWAILVDQIDACAIETAMLLWIEPENGNPKMEQVSGPSEDGDIAMRIIGRDIGAVPPVKEYKLGPLTKSLMEAHKAIVGSPAAANDNINPATGQNERLPVINPADWQGQVIPPREWYIDGLIPARNVTILSGDGGLGKSLAAIQIGVAGALGVETLGLMPKNGKCFYLGAEDEADEFQRRMAEILAYHHCDFEDLGDNFRLSAMAGEDAILAMPDARTKVMQPTAVMAALVEEVMAYNPDLLVLDTSADLFGGDEINRSQVRQFVGMLRKLAIAIDCTVLLLSHPSIQGMQSGTGLSGSTGWNNSVRSRLYLTKPDGKGEDPDLRVLTNMKNNYGKSGDGIKMRWQDGLFVLDDGKPSMAAGILRKEARKVFLSVLSKLNRQGQRLSPNPSATYAPKIISAHPDAKGLGKKELAAAQQHLLDEGEIRIVEEGPPSRKYRRLLVSSEMHGAA